MFPKMLDLHAKATNITGMEDADHALLAAVLIAMVKAAHAMLLAHLGNLTSTLVMEAADKVKFGMLKGGNVSVMA